MAANRQPAEAPVAIRLKPSKRSIGVGDRFEVAIQIDAAQPVSHLPITLNYNDKRLQVLDVWAGDFLGSEQEGKFLSEYSEPGRIVIGASRLGDRAGVQGRGTVAYIQFRALAKGRAAIRFEKGRALDQDLAPIQPIKKEKTILRIGSEGEAIEPPDSPRPTEPPARGDLPVRG